MFFLPGNLAKWTAIFLFISEFPFLVSPQIVIIISDTGGVTYAIFGLPFLFLTTFLYLFLFLTFISFQNLFETTNRTRLGRKKK
jgi:hypothetical protein